MTEYPFDSTSAVPPESIATAWERELPGVPVSSIGVITPLWRAAKALADDRRRTLRRIGIDPATLDLLSTLRRSGEPWALTTRELAAQTLVTAGAISQRVARAEQAGLVTRSPSDAGRRAVAVTLTAAGHELVERAVRDLLAHEEELIGGLSPQDRRTLGELLGRLTSAWGPPARQNENPDSGAACGVPGHPPARKVVSGHAAAPDQSAATTSR